LGEDFTGCDSLTQQFGSRYPLQKIPQAFEITAKNIRQFHRPANRQANANEHDRNKMTHDRRGEPCYPASVNNSEVRMLLVGGLVVIGSVVAFIAGVFMLLFLSGRRKRGLKIAAGSVLAFVISTVVVATTSVDQDATAAGFASWSDQRDAEKAGITDPVAWAQHRQEAEAAAEREKAAAAEAEQRRAEAEKKAEAEKAAKERRLGFHCLSPWDGSHAEFELAVRNQLREPGSFEHMETRVAPIDSDGRNTIIMTFRARNGFGGMNINQAMGSFSNATCGSVSVDLIE
jgi:uncharacterized membrane protein